MVSFQFHKKKKKKKKKKIIIQGRHFVVGGPKTFKLLPDISFDSGSQKILWSNLLLFFCVCYKLISY